MVSTDDENEDGGREDSFFGGRILIRTLIINVDKITVSHVLRKSPSVGERVFLRDCSGRNVQAGKDRREAAEMGDDENTSERIPLRRVVGVTIMSVLVRGTRLRWHEVDS
jgi:hypothetical protein